jgi:hypothetical protein
MFIKEAYETRIKKEVHPLSLNFKERKPRGSLIEFIFKQT